MLKSRGLCMISLISVCKRLLVFLFVGPFFFLYPQLQTILQLICHAHADAVKPFYNMEN